MKGEEDGAEPRGNPGSRSGVCCCGARPWEGREGRDGAAEGNRTPDLTLTKGVLYRLSYGSEEEPGGGAVTDESKRSTRSGIPTMRPPTCRQRLGAGPGQKQDELVAARTQQAEDVLGEETDAH